ncbi:MAG: SAM-dependent methyltransferase [Thermoleophilia bacterium]|nr:SAM-dependent methyltransferase [Thermoleophilia bacterium]
MPDMRDHSHHHAHPPTSAHDHAFTFDSDRMAALLETEGELASGITDQAIALCIEFGDVDCSEVRRVTDLGCGPGVATSLLAAAFVNSIVVGVDASAVMLARAARRAELLGVSGRVDLRLLDIDDDLRALDTFDLVWAALALHHTIDEKAALNSFASLIRPRGLLCLLERADPIVVRPANELGQPGIWDRVAQAQSVQRERARGSLPGVKSVETYVGMIEQSGLELLELRTLVDSVDVFADEGLQATIHWYVGSALRNLRDTLRPTDVEALTDAGGRTTDIVWGDTLVTSTRTLFVARQPGRR